MDRIIWQPKFISFYDFEIRLDRNFSKKAITSPMSAEKQRRMNKLANKDLKTMEIDFANPYTFHKDTYFVSQISIGEGVWLCTTYRDIEGLLKNSPDLNWIKYLSHNVDTSKKAYSLLKLFDKWMWYSKNLREK